MPYIWERSSEQLLDGDLVHTCSERIKSGTIRRWEKADEMFFGKTNYVGSPECAASDGVVWEEDGCSCAGVRGARPTL